MKKKANFFIFGLFWLGFCDTENIYSRFSQKILLPMHIGGFHLFNQTNLIKIGRKIEWYSSRRRLGHFRPTIHYLDGRKKSIQFEWFRRIWSRFDDDDVMNAKCHQINEFINELYHFLQLDWKHNFSYRRRSVVAMPASVTRQASSVAWTLCRGFALSLDTKQKYIYKNRTTIRMDEKCWLDARLIERERTNRKEIEGKVVRIIGISLHRILLFYAQNYR